MFSFHPIIQSNYLEVHKWLSRQEINYRQNNAWNKVKKQLENQTLESAALQYYVLFPPHFAKVAFALEQIIGADQLAKWLKYNSQVVVIDVGCGAGAASVAFANSVLNLCESEQIQHPIFLHFVGIDPNLYAIALYRQQIAGLKSKIEQYSINITFQLISESDLRAVNQLREELTKRRKSWGTPFLTHAFLLQSNVVSPFSVRYHEAESRRREMEALGVLSEELGVSQEVFGKEEAIAYKQILENAFIDNLHIVTVGTDGYEQRVKELAQAIDNEFQGNNHIVERLGGGECSVTYEIPDGCYWKEFKNNAQWTLGFCVEVSSISNVALADKDWRNIQSTENLQSAWARARHHLLGQALVDEVEIRLFESNLDTNIVRLQQQLVVYAQDVVHADDRLHFKFPKGNDKLRPLGMSRIEEEILSTALIQKLGQRISGIASRSYAYRFSRTYGNDRTEYLYENWFDAYSKFIKEARDAAQDNVGCVVIQTDIKSFYTRIIRDNLVQLSTEQLSSSNRVKWLLRVLFSRDIDEHEAGRGVVQGNIASGFFANLYLIDLDARFGPNNEWNAQFFRYVDDMIIVVPDPEHVEAVLATLEQELANIDLALNVDKTECFTDVSEFLSITDKDETLDNLQNQFQSWVNCLWILDEQHRQVFRKAYNDSRTEWWYRVELYRKCLESIGVFIDVTLLSRRIYKYLFSDRRCEKDFSWQQPFEIPLLPDSIDEDQVNTWKIEFAETNKSWVEEKTILSDTIRELFLKSYAEIKDAVALQNTRNEKRWARTLRFCINKLTQIGFQHNDDVAGRIQNLKEPETGLFRRFLIMFQRIFRRKTVKKVPESDSGAALPQDFHTRDIAQVVVEILVESPWLVRNPHKLVESLAIQKHTNHIKSLLSHYTDETDEMKEYMKSITLRAIRFLPYVPNILWQQVVESSVSLSNVVSLMATETWLRVIQNQPELVEEAHLQQIEFALNREPKPILRLRKNYLLILGEHRNKIGNAAKSTM